jgi:hypothetical protein
MSISPGRRRLENQLGNARRGPPWTVAGQGAARPGCLHLRRSPSWTGTGRGHRCAARAGGRGAGGEEEGEDLNVFGVA